MKKNVFGLLALVGAFLFAACSNPMIASGSSEDETAPTPVVRVVAAPTSYVIGESSSLIATVSGNGKGKVSYQWYKLTKNGEETSESPIEEGAEEAVYVSKETKAGDYVYFVRVSNVLGNSIKTVDSDPVTITVKAKELATAKDPFLTLAVDDTVFVKGVKFKLVATAASRDDGELSYQWYRKSAENTDFVAITGATSAIYETSEAEPGTYEYKIEVTNTLNNTSAKKSESIEISIVDVAVVDAVKPVFTKVLSAKQYAKNEENPEELSVAATVTDGGLVTYKWYLVDGENETVVAGNVDKFTPPVSETGKFIYKVTATNNNKGATGVKTAEDSLMVEITVLDTTLINAEPPVINEQPVSAEYVEGDTNVTPLSVTATSKDNGTLSYQWYKDNAPIADGKEASYTPSVSEVGTSKYYVVVTNTIEDNKDGGVKSSTATSEAVEVVVKEFVPEEPKFGTNLPTGEEKTVDENGSITLTVKAESAKATYQWYTIDDGKETLLNNKTDRSLVIYYDTVGTFKYFCRISETIERNGKTYPTSADSITYTLVVKDKIVIVDAVAPVIKATIENVSYEQNAQASEIDATAEVTDSGKITYQWFKFENAAWKAITEDTETAAKYTPATAEVDEVLYKVVVTNTNENVNGEKTAKTEKTVTVTVTAPVLPEKPEITAQPQSKEYNKNADVTALSVEAKVNDGGDLSYQWYIVKDSGDEPITANGTSATYTPSSAEAGVTKYKVVVTNTLNGKTEKTASLVAIITVVDPDKRNAKEPTFTTDLSVTEVEYTVGTAEAEVAALTVAAVSDDSDATISYVWYKNGEIIKVNGETYTGASYKPDVGTTGTFTYQVLAVSKIPADENVGIDTASAASKIATIVVKEVPVINAKAPKITTDLPAAASYVQGDALTLSVAAESEDGGTLSYQWYKKTPTDTEDVKVGENSASYTEDTRNAVGTAEYHVVITNTNESVNGQKTASVPSKTVSVVVTAFTIPEPPVTVERSKSTIKLGEEVTLTAHVDNYTATDDFTYAWKLNEATIPGEESSTLKYTPTEVKKYDFYCTVTAKKVNGTYTAIKSNTSTDTQVNVSDWTAETPTVTTTSTDKNYDVGATEVTALAVTASVADGGTLSYQWFKAADASAEGTAIDGATSTSYTPVTTSADDSYYYVVVTNTAKIGTVERTATKTFGRFHIQVVTQYKYAATPEFSANLVSANYKQGDTVTALNATADAVSSDNAVKGTITYQWYSNGTESTVGGTALTGETSATYTPSIAETGTTYYYCIATNTVPETTENLDPDTSKHSASATSSIAKIVVTQLTARKPIASITYNKNEYTIGDSEQVVLTAECSYASSDDGEVGTISYQWYEVDGEDLIEIGTDSATYTVPADVSEGTHSYTVKITNTVNATTAATSENTTAKEITITASTGSGGITIDFN